MSEPLSKSDLREIVLPLLRKHGLKTALLFGSYARDEATADSDIDLLIERGNSARPLSVYALGEDVREATGKRVDVFDLTELNEGPFKQAVLSEAVEL